MAGLFVCVKFGLLWIYNIFYSDVFKYILLNQVNI